ncbi:hypothetical protein [Methanobrevibacter sp. V14]|uniref:hypothetical protein n=1 Tax=Methanobrevibacter sp. V14 TaxID=3064280 RepID=UPI0027329700|nr:hypothetical protein [Methanobrevibacter sp. V14]
MVMSPPEINYDESTEMYVTSPASLNDNYFESNPISYLKYFESFEFKFNELSNNFNLINPKEIHEFILLHDDLFDYLNELKNLLQLSFKNNDFCIEFSIDPEDSLLNQLVIYINSNDSSFDSDWELLRKVNKKIRSFDKFPSSLKKLVSVDLW